MPLHPQKLLKILLNILGKETFHQKIKKKFPLHSHQYQINQKVKPHKKLLILNEIMKMQKLLKITHLLDLGSPSSSLLHKKFKTFFKKHKYRG